jgi:hypothetical protein
MGWEARPRGGRYYTRSRKVGGRVVREYVGGGLAGELAARQDERERDARLEEAGMVRRQRARVAEAGVPLDELCDLSDLMVRAALLAAGYRRHHRGEWRRRRGEA